MGLYFMDFEISLYMVIINITNNGVNHGLVVIRVF